MKARIVRSNTKPTHRHANLVFCSAAAIALTLTLPAQAQSLQEVAQQYVDQNYGNNPLAILAGNGCKTALVGTSFSPTVRNCSQLRNYAYQYWQTVYSPGSFGR